MRSLAQWGAAAVVFSQQLAILPEIRPQPITRGIAAHRAIGATNAWYRSPNQIAGNRLCGLAPAARL